MQMSIERTRETMQAYLGELKSFGDFARYFTDDVTMTFMGTDRSITGRDQVRGVITAVHEVAFRTAVELKTLVCAEDHALLEAEFVGTHIGDFEGIAATHRNVRVPYAVAYDFVGARISALRLYLPLELLIRQLTGVSEPAAAAV
jgi:predicted ester cyclase